MSTQPDWYDVLGVRPDADATEIRAAWKQAVADLDPTSPSFRVFNQAAEVLLDVERRATYDATRAAEDQPAQDEPAQDEPAQDEPAQDEPAEEAEEPETPDGELPMGEQPAASAAGTPRLSVVIAVAWAAVLLLVLAWLVAPKLGEQTHEWFGSESADTSRSGKSTASEQEMSSAVAAAEQAAAPVLEYDYRKLEANESAAIALMTEEFGAAFRQFFALIKQDAPANKTVVTVKVVASAVGEVTEETVDVLLYIDRATLNKGRSTPAPTYDQVTLTMKQVGDTWRVSDMRIQPPETR